MFNARLRIVAFLLLSFVCLGCTSNVPEEADNSRIDSVIAAAKQHGEIFGYASKLQFVDSAISGKELSVTEKYKVFTLKFNTYFSQLQDYTHARLYADSIVWIVDHNNMKNIGDKQFTAYKQLAEVQYALEDYKQAYENYDIARYIADTVKAGNAKAKYTASLAMAYFKEEEYRQAARMFAASYNQSLFVNPESIKYFNYFQQEQLSNAALSYARAQMRDSAIYYFHKADSFIRKKQQSADTGAFHRWDEALSVLYGNLATLYKDNNLYDSAVLYYLRCIDLSNITGRNVQDLRYNKLKLADVYMSLGKTVDAGLIIAQVDSTRVPATEVVRPEDTVEYSLRNAQVKARYYRVTGDHDEAFYWLDRHYHFLEMKNARIQKIKLNNIESGVDNIGHEKQIQVLAKDSKIHNQRITILVLVIIVSIFTIIIIYYYMRLHKLNSEKLRMEKEHIISESRSTQEKLQKQMDVDRANYLALLENTEDCLWSLDSNLNLLAFNKVYSEFIKVVTGGEARVGERDELEKTSPEFYQQIHAGYQAALAGKVYNSMDEGIKTGGVHFDYAMRFTPVRDKQGRVTGVSCSRKDITEFFNLTNSLKKNTEQFKNIAWLQSHALRGPLATVMGIAELLSDGEDDTIDHEQMRELLKGMKEKLQELDKLVNEIVKLTY